MSAFIWNGSENVRNRLLGRMKDLIWSQACRDWSGSNRVLTSSRLASIDTWLSPMEMSLEREGRFPAWLLSTFQVAAFRLPGDVAGGWIDTLSNQLTADVSLQSLEAVQTLLEQWLFNRHGNSTACRKYLPELLLVHPRSADACNAVLKMLIQQFALLGTLRHLQSGTTTPALVPA